MDCCSYLCGISQLFTTIALLESTLQSVFTGTYNACDVGFIHEVHLYLYRVTT